MKRAVVIKMETAEKPLVSEKQRELCKKLISVGLSRVAITAIIMSKDADRLTISDQRAGLNAIRSCTEELGYGIIDARNAKTPAMIQIVQTLANKCNVRVKIA